MNDAFPMCGIERIANLRRVLQSLIDRHRARERFALDVLHDKVIRPHVVKLAQVRMIQCCGCLRLAREALGEVGLTFFDRNEAVQARVARLPNFAHAACAELLKDLVRAEFLTAS